MNPTAHMERRVMKIYLAGGMRTDWRNSIKEAAPQFDYLDPTQHGLETPAEYTAWDIAAIKQADLMIAFLQSTNPFGYNMAFELGIADALGKRFILINEKVEDRGVSMLIERAFASYKSFDDFMEKWIDNRAA